MEKQSSVMLPQVAKVDFDKLEQTALKSPKGGLLSNSELSSV